MKYLILIVFTFCIVFNSGDKVKAQDEGRYYFAYAISSYDYSKKEKKLIISDVKYSSCIKPYTSGYLGETAVSNQWNDYFSAEYKNDHNFRNRVVIRKSEAEAQKYRREIIADYNDDYEVTKIDDFKVYCD